MSRWRAGLSLLLTAAIPACAAPQPKLTPAQLQELQHLIGVRRAIQSAAQQVRPCYRAPRVNREARQIVTVLRVRYGADGALLGQPELVRQSGVDPDNSAFASQMAAAAATAVMRCTPLSLPSDYHENGWDEFELTFSPKGLA